MCNSRYRAFYKGHHIICFYDKTGENFINYFDNVRQIIIHRGLTLSRTRINQFNVELYRALRSETHHTKMLDGKNLYTVWLADIDDDDSDLILQNLYYLKEARTNKYITLDSKLVDNIIKADKFNENELNDFICTYVNVPIYIIQATTTQCSNNT